MKLTPLDDRVVIRPQDAESVSPGGIVIPDVAKEKPSRGEVLAIGPGRLLEDGTRAAMSVEVGMEVLYSKYSGTEIEVDKEDVCVIRETDILAVVER
jgi:chaperonin GroES